MGIRELLNIENLQVQAGKRIGLVGKNGSGKTTLFRILMNELDADIGQFSVDGRMSLLPQLKPTETSKSGGEVSQDYIVRILNEAPGTLLADEPTTNLDTSHVEWVEKKLKEFQGTVLLISHDRTLLDSVCDTIWELSDGEITEYSGNYSDYVIQKENEKNHQQKEYKKYQNEKRQLEEAIRAKKEQAQRATKRPKNVSNSEARITGVKTHFANKQKKLRKTVTVMETRLENLEVVKRSNKLPPIQMDLPNEESFRNRTVLRVQNISGVVGDRLLWKKTNFQVQGGDKLAIIGANGSGKTTLLKKILNESDSDIYLSPAVKVGYFSQNMDVLDADNTIIENVKKESKQTETLIRIVLARFGFYQNDVEKKVKVLSGGERVKVSLAKIFVSDCNTLILDEPTNFLDVYALEALEELLVEYEGTVLIVSHDRSFISSIATKILAFEDNELIFFEGTYEEYLNRDQENERDIKADELARIENEIAAVLSQLSIEPTDELDKKFQELIKKKREIEN